MLLITKIESNISLIIQKGVLSDKSIKKLLGVHIFIYPFKNKNLQAASYDLTASKCAFIVENDEQKLIVNGDWIIIPKHMTAMIETNESIYVSKRIAGTYHSLVGLTNRGIGHIGTTLDPNYFGVSTISMHNTTDKEIRIRVGEPIASIEFSVTNKKSSGVCSTLCNHIRYNFNVEHPKFYYNYSEDIEKDIYMILNCNKEMYLKLKNNPELYISNVKLVNKEEINSCSKCLVCENREGCGLKIIKNYNDLNEKQNKVIEEIKLWSEEEFRVNVECLKRMVRKYVVKRDLNKDIVIISFFIITIGVIIDLVLSLFWLENKNSTIALVGVTLTIITLISGIIINFKLKEQKD